MTEMKVGRRAQPRHTRSSSCLMTELLGCGYREDNQHYTAREEVVPGYVRIKSLCTEWKSVPLGAQHPLPQLIHLPVINKNTSA